MTIHCVGKRKTAVARIFVKDLAQKNKSGDITLTVNGKSGEHYFVGRFFHIATASFVNLRNLLLAISLSENVLDRIKGYKFSQNDMDFISATSSDKAKEFLALISGIHFDIDVCGGGISAQSDAVKFGIAKLFASLNHDLIKFLRMFGFLTRDVRVVERKKPGFRKARKKEKYSKR